MFSDKQFPVNSNILNSQQNSHECIKNVKPGDTMSKAKCIWLEGFDKKYAS